MQWSVPSPPRVFLGGGAKWRTRPQSKTLCNGVSMALRKQVGNRNSKRFVEIGCFWLIQQTLSYSNSNGVIYIAPPVGKPRVVSLSYSLFCSLGFFAPLAYWSRGQLPLLPCPVIVTPPCHFAAWRTESRAALLASAVCWRDINHLHRNHRHLFVPGLSRTSTVSRASLLLYRWRRNGVRTCCTTNDLGSDLQNI